MKYDNDGPKSLNVFLDYLNILRDLILEAHIFEFYL